MSVRLETNADIALEEKTITRLVATAQKGTIPVRLPDLSAIDYLFMLDDDIVAFIEIKTRKETMEQVKKYGGLMLKYRKLTELQSVCEMLRVKTFVAFAFENGDGPIFLCEPIKICNAEPVVPPARKNFRGLACDEEPVVYLDWSNDLKRIL